MKILIVDDSITIRTLLKVQIRQNISELLSAGQTAEIREADSGELGLEIYYEFRPDVVFLDIHMPSMTGIEVLTQIKTINDKKNEVPIIMVSSDTDPDQIQRCKNGQAFGFVKKPFKAKAIGRALANAIDFRSQAKGD